VMFVNVVKTSM